MHYDEYKPTATEIEREKESIKQQRIAKLKNTKTVKNAKRTYQRRITNVPTDTRPVFGPKYQ
ncbi:MAG: hypothetical protein WC919_03195 [Candidatus Paceibacterota bacterium]|jgi:hypothetical protein